MEKFDDNFDSLFATTIDRINWAPDYICEPRGQKIKEIIAPTLILSNPRARLLANPARDTNYGFAVGEFLWYWTGRQDLKTMLYYNKRMKDFSDDGTVLNSAYGYRMKTEEHVGTSQNGVAVFSSQWDTCKQTLLKDKDSRRAIILINRSIDQFNAELKGSKDVPCTLSLQFFIRNNKLICHAHMRSNDAFWGLTYDLFSFTLFQEMMLLELKAAGMKDLELGEYYHTAGSLHIYERHFEMATSVANAYYSNEFRVAEPMEPLDLEGLARLVEDEEALRTGKIDVIDETLYSGGVRWLGQQLVSHRRKRDAERRREVGSGDGAGNLVQQ